MSDPAQVPPSPPASPGRHPLAAAFMLIVGLILLLPGLCSVVFMAMSVTNLRDSGLFAFLLPLWLVSFLISAGGIALIRRAFR